MYKQDKQEKKYVFTGFNEKKESSICKYHFIINKLTTYNAYRAAL